MRNSKIFLAPEVRSGLGEDTFWTWFARETGAEFDIPRKIGTEDVVIHYSTLGRPKFAAQTITLLWELYPEMRLRVSGKFPTKLWRINRSQSSRWATCPTAYSRAFYSRETVVLPIGVDTSLFKPPHDKLGLRRTLGLQAEAKYAIWSGANHPMKGPDLRDQWSSKNTDWKLIVVRKEEPIPQSQLAQLIAASDAFLNTSRLVPLYMFEWECLAADLPMLDAGGIEREFIPSNPRQFVFEQRWSREQSLEIWVQFIERCRYQLRNT